MANFMEELWGSIFTPGPTTTLLIATNATFAALQLCLLVLLIITYSIHFVVLSFLCAGLWWAINWFAVEVRIAQAKEEEEKAARDGALQEGSGEESDIAGVDTDAEVEKDQHGRGVSSALVDLPAAATSINSTETRTVGGEIIGEGKSFQTSAAARLAPEGILRKRRSLADSGELSASTDGEWEQVEPER